MVEKVGIIIALITSILTVYNLYLTSKKLKLEIKELELKQRKRKGK